MNEKINDLLVQCKAVKNCKLGPLIKAQLAEKALYLAADTIVAMAEKIERIERREGCAHGK